MRMLHLIHHLDVGGAEVLLAELLPRQRDDGIDAQVGCLLYRGRLGDRLKSAGQPIHCIDKSPWRPIRNVRRLRQLVREHAIDLLHMHEYSAGLWGCLTLATLGRRRPRSLLTVHSEAGWDNPRKHRVVNTLFKPFTDRFVAVSETVRTSLITREHVPGDRIEVIANGIDLKRFCPRDRLAARRELGLPASRPIVGMVARCRAEKGGLDLITALTTLAGKQDVLGLIVGDGPDRKAWQDAAARAQLDGRLQFIDPVPDPATWLAALDVVVCPSREESFGLTAMEALAVERPVVATRVGGFRELLTHEQHALLVPPGDTDALAGSITRLLEEPDLANRLARTGREMVTASFPMERMVQAYSACYARLQSMPRETAPCL